MDMNRNPEGKGGFKDHPENINRKGRVPTGESMSDLLKIMMDEEKTIDLTDKKGKPTGRVRKVKLKTLFLEAVIRNALAGREQSQKTVMNYYDGYPKQNIEVEGRFATIHTDIPLTPEQEARYAERLQWLFKEKEDVNGYGDTGRSLRKDEPSDDVDGSEIPPDAQESGDPI